MTPRSIRIPVILAVALAAALGAAAQERPKVTIAVGTTVFDASQANNTSLPIYTKCWEREGIDVTLQPTNSTAAMQALLTGQAQFVNMGPGAAIVARTKGAPIKAVYLNMRRNFQFPVVLESSPIKTITDFKGKTIGVISYGAQLVEIIKGMIAEAGLDPNKDVTFVETGVGAQAIAALKSGQVDIWGTWDSQIATAESMGIKLRKFTTTQAEKLTFGGSYFVRDDYVTKQPQVIEKVLRCVAEGSAMMIANPKARCAPTGRSIRRPSRPTSTTPPRSRRRCTWSRRATSSSSPRRERSGASCRRRRSRRWSTSCAPTSASRASSIPRISTPTSSSPA
jgi:NitT/TauT family transport system substrate-binding protein